MGETAKDGDEIFDASGFLDHFSGPTNLRQSAKVINTLGAVRFMALLAVRAESGTLANFAATGEKNGYRNSGDAGRSRRHTDA
jgi:hypothetical protein